MMSSWAFAACSPCIGCDDPSRGFRRGEHDVVVYLEGEGEELAFAMVTLRQTSGNGEQTSNLGSTGAFWE